MPAKHLRPRQNSHRPVVGVDGVHDKVGGDVGRREEHVEFPDGAEVPVQALVPLRAGCHEVAACASALAPVREEPVHHLQDRLAVQQGCKGGVVEHRARAACDREAPAPGPAVAPGQQLPQLRLGPAAGVVHAPALPRPQRLPQDDEAEVLEDPQRVVHPAPGAHGDLEALQVRRPDHRYVGHPRHQGPVGAGLGHRGLAPLEALLGHALPPLDVHELHPLVVPRHARLPPEAQAGVRDDLLVRPEGHA
mmetsp:Transcript_29541/g.94151  ORF Transcript_29541/g.94151 Transcript_29541/m.94151 type:complete len:249 (-) Transcript_29541:426-1172(-)